jgi:hypothetical protein
MTKTARDLLKQVLERRIADENPKNWVPGDEVIGELKRAQRRDEAKARPKRARGR